MPSRSSVRLLAAASLGALGLIAAPGARAVFMPPAGFLEETGVTSIADIHGTDPLLAESIAFDNRIPSIASGHGRAATSGGSIPMASAHVDLVSETVYRDIWGGAYASVDYYFMLEQTGGTPVTEQIPLDIVTRGVGMGRSVLDRGRFARRDELPSKMAADPLGFVSNSLGELPPIVPNGMINPATVRAFSRVSSLDSSSKAARPTAMARGLPP